MTRDEFDRQMRTIRLQNIGSVVAGLVMLACVLAMMLPTLSVIRDAPARLVAAIAQVR